MNKVTLLPKWTLTSTFPSVYDTESGTCIEMTAKVYAAMRDLQTNYNKFVDEINTCITEFQNGVIESQKEFEEKIIKLIHDYIKTLDLKVAHQDRVIEESITFIKNNIADGVRQVITEMKESGELADTILDSMDGFATKVNGIEENVTTLTNDLKSLSDYANTNVSAINEEIESINNKIETSKPYYIYDSESESLTFINIGNSGGVE